MSTHHDWDRQTEQDLASGALAQLAPPPPAFDEAWVERTLDAIVREGEPARRRVPWKRLAAALTVAVLGTGGVAFAAGIAPDFIARGVADLADRQRAVPPAMELIADVRLPGGGRLAAWRGVNADQECQAVAHNWDGREGARGYGMGCGRPAPADDPDRDELRIRQTFSPDAAQDTYYPVVFGSVDEERVASARIRGRLFGGETFSREVRTDPATGGFGVRVPGERSRASLQREWETPAGEMERWDSRLQQVQVDLLDATGRVVEVVEVLDVQPTALPSGLSSYDDLGR